MLQVLFSWLVITICVIPVGIAIIKMIKKIFPFHIDIAEITSELPIIIGLCACIVYAQLFSLFYKLGSIALGVLFAISILLFWFFHEEIFCLYHVKIWKIVLAVPMILLFALYTAQTPNLYDTGLYHAQTIRWLEEYGVVKGLGNLHFRFAFNSSLLPLQALFSMKFIMGQSLHSLNGYIMTVMTIYTISKVLWNVLEDKKLSNYFAVSILWYLSSQPAVIIASPGTDMGPLLFFLYVLIKYQEIYEKKKDQGLGQEILVIMIAATAVTMKLSTGMLAILGVIVFFKVLQKSQGSSKMWNSLKYIAVCDFMVLPFIIRNIIISGYLFFPMSKIDLFKVDWKIPTDTVDMVSKGTMEYARHRSAVGMYPAFTDWFPRWCELNRPELNMIIWALAALLLCIVIIFFKYRQEWKHYTTLVSMEVISILYWFFTAPDMRFGRLYFHFAYMLLLGLSIGILPEKITKVFRIVLLLYFSVTIIKWYTPVMKQHTYRMADYVNYKMKETEVDGITFFYPKKKDQTGYESFPSTPFYEVLDGGIKLRGAELKDGFRSR